MVASLLGDPARANMLTALIDGTALTAGELAREAGVTAQTASSHLAKLQAGGLVSVRRQGRHGYFSLTGPDVAAVLEGLMSLAVRTGRQRTRPGPADPALRRSRVCYDHLAGALGVALYDSLIERDLLRQDETGPSLTVAGERFFEDFGVDLGRLRTLKRPLCRSCLDWSARRSHLAGSLGAAVLDRLFALGWASRVKGTRLVAFTTTGARSFEQAFQLSAAQAA